MRNLAIITLALALAACTVDLPTRDELGIPPNTTAQVASSQPGCVEGLVEVTNSPLESSFWRSDFIAYPHEVLTAQYRTKDDMRDYVLSWGIAAGTADIAVLTYNTVQIKPTSQGVMLEATLTDIYTNERVYTCGTGERAYIFVQEY